MDVAAANPSVARGFLVRSLREMKVDQDIVGWTGSFMQERSARMVIGGKEEESSRLLLSSHRDHRSPR